MKTRYTIFGILAILSCTLTFGGFRSYANPNPEGLESAQEEVKADQNQRQINNAFASADKNVNYPGSCTTAKITNGECGVSEAGGGELKTEGSAGSATITNTKTEEVNAATNGKTPGTEGTYKKEYEQGPDTTETKVIENRKDGTNGSSSSSSKVGPERDSTNGLNLYQRVSNT